MTEQVLAHPVNLFRVAWDFLMENTSPNQSIKFVFRLKLRCTIDKKVDIEVSTNSIEVVFDILEFLELPEHLYRFHFGSDHLVEGFNQVLTKVVSEFVLSKVSEPLI